MFNFNPETSLTKRSSERELSIPAKIPHLAESALLEYDLIRCIQILYKLHQKESYRKNPPRTLEKLAEKIRNNEEIKPSPQMEHLAQLVNNLISKQFANPIVEALREVITNALDAQSRAGSTNTPINISFVKDTFTISDQGDGMGTDKLIPLFVPGISSNGNALFDPAATIEGNTGRFGQGALSAFHLITPNDKIVITPADEQSVSIQCDMIVDNTLHAVVQNILKDNPQNRNFSAKPIKDSKKPKITIQSWNGDKRSDPIKINVSYKKTGHTIQLKKVPFREQRGTHYTVRSTKLSEQTVKAALDYFKFIDPNKPIRFNGELINPPPSDYKCLQFDGGRLLAKEASESEYGQLRILEKGRKILSIPCRGIGLFQEVVLDFDVLHPSQDRATVNWNNPGLVESLANLVKVIIENAHLSDQDKITLFNSLCFLPKIRNFDLKLAFEPFLKPIENRLLPNTRHFRILVNNSHHYYFIHESAIGEIKAFDKTVWEGCNIYLLSDPPFVAYKIKYRQKDHYFFYKKIFPDPDAPNFTLLAQMVNCWINSAHHDQPQGHFDPNTYLLKFSEALKGQPSEKQPAINELQDQVDTGTHQVNDFESLVNALQQKAGSIPECPHRDVITNIADNYRVMAIDDQVYSVGNCILVDPSEPANLSAYLFLVTNFIDCSVELSKLQPNFKNKFFKYYSRLLLITLGRFYRQTQFDITAAVTLLGRVINEDMDFFRQLSTPEGCSFALQTLLFIRIVRTDEPITIAHYKDTLFAIAKFSELHPNLILMAQLAIRDNEISKISDLEIFTKMSNFELSAVNYTPFEMLSYYPSEVVHELKRFFERLSPDLLESILCMFMLPLGLPNQDEFMDDMIDDTPVDFLDFTRNLSAYPNPFIEMVVKATDARFHMYRTIATWTDAFSKYCDTARELLIPPEILKDVHDTIYLPFRSEPEIALDLTQLYFNFYFLSVLFYKKADRGKLYNLLHFITSLVKKDPSFLNIKHDVLRILEAGFNNQADKIYCSSKATPVSSHHEFIKKLMEKGVNLRSTSILLLNMAMKGTGNYKNTSYAFPAVPKDLATPLDEDSDVVHTVGSVDKARQEIAGAIRQNLNGYKFIIKELIRNSSDAGCKQIHILTGKDEEGNFYVDLIDDGSGMNEKAFKALKTPNCSTKNQSGNSPTSYGMGFFSVFSEGAFDEVCVTTSEGTGIGRLAYFSKGEGAQLKYYFRNENLSGGQIPHSNTRLILKKRCDPGTVDQECLFFSLEVENTVSEVVNPAIFLNDVLISKHANDDIAGTILDYPGTVGNSKLIIASSDRQSGIYRECLRIGPVDNQYYDLVPQFMKDYIKEKRIDFKILLPLVDQVMTRASVVDSEDLAKTLQYGILWTSIKTILLNLPTDAKNADHRFIPFDYWYDFRYHNKEMPQQVVYFVEALIRGAVGPIFTDGFSQYLDGHESYFSENRDRMILPKRRQGNANGKETLDSFFKVSIEGMNTLNFDQLIQFILRHKQFVTDILVNIPLHETATIKSVRNEIAAKLSTCGILNDKNDYNPEHAIFTHHDDLSVRQMIESELSAIIIKYKSTCLNKFVELFLDNIIGRINTIADLMKVKAEDLTSYEPIGKFLRIMCKKVLDKNITYKIEHTKRGNIAHSFPGKSCIYINVASQPFRSLTDSMQAIVSKEKSAADLIPHYEKVAMALLTLSHEATHMEESPANHFTHDDKFFLDVNARYERFMMRFADDDKILNESIQESLK